MDIAFTVGCPVYSLNKSKRWRFCCVQILVWCNSLSLVPALLKDSPLAIRCLVLACATVSAGSGFKLTQLRKHAPLLSLLLQELEETGETTSMMAAVRKVSKIYVSMILGLLCGWLSYPWLRGELDLLLDYWAPPATKQDFLYFCILYSFTSLGLVAVAHTQEAVDTLLLLIAAFLCRKLERVSKKLEDVDIQEVQSRSAIGDTSANVLKMAWMEHVECIRLIRDFDKLLSNIFLVQVLQTTIVSTMCFFSASKIGDIQEVPKFLMIVSVTYMQFFIYCWLGEEISQHSTGLHRAIYQSRWYSCNLETKKMVNRLQTFTKCFFRLKGCGVFDIHLKTFLVMIKESFSAFMVMRAVSK